MQRTQKPSKGDIRKGMKNSVKDGIGYSVHSTVLANYITPYSLVLGADAIAVGLLNALPKLAGILAQPYANREIQREKDDKRYTVNLSFLRSTFILPLIGIPFIFGNIFLGG